MWLEIQETIANLSTLEVIATLSFILYVILATRQHPFCWPVSMIGVAIMVYISYEAKLYADILLNTFYFFISIYGIYNWMRGGKQKQELPVTRSSNQLLLTLGALCLGSFFILGFALDNYTDTDVAYWDSATTIMSFAGTYLLAEKKIENWIVWIVVDAIYVWLYFYKELVLLSGLNIFYVIISFYGLYQWYKSMRQNQNPQHVL